MKNSVLAVLLAAIGLNIGVPCPAFSRGPAITEEGIARTTSLYFAIAEYCPSFFNVNTDLARKLGEATYGLGMKNYGEKRFYATVGKEFDRRKKEVEITGAKQWCDYQHSHQAKISGSKEANLFID